MQPKSLTNPQEPIEQCSVGFLLSQVATVRLATFRRVATCAKHAYESAKEHWANAVSRGGKTERLIESSDIFRGLDLAGLPPTDEMEKAVEDALSEGGYNTLAAEAYEEYKHQGKAFGA